MARKTASIWLQSVLFIALIAAAAAAWMKRDVISEAVARYSGSNESEGKSGKKRRGEDGGVPVIVAKVGEAVNDEVISAVGTARARRSIMVHPETDGVLVALPPKPGDRVKTGQIIAQLNPTKADLAVEIASRRLDEARRLLDRSEFLKQRSVQSNARVEDAQTSLERAELELLQAREARRDLNILAPFDGLVGIANVEVGERVTTSTALVSLDDRSEVLIEFEVGEKYLSRISVGHQVSGRTPSYEDRTFSGSVEFIDSRVDPTSRTVKVRAAIPNPDDELRPGMSFVVDVKLPGSAFAEVPELSLQWRKGESYVWVVEDGKAKKVLVTVKARLNSTILVDGNLKPGQLVVVEGVQRLRPGRAVDFAVPPETESQETVGEKAAPAEARQEG